MIDSIIRKVLSRRLSKINFFKKHPEDVQKSMFDMLIMSAKDTEFGKKYDYSSVKSYQDYQNRVPVLAYEDFSPYIDRVMNNGEQNLLWNSKITWFSKSSGTTNARSKFIPVSKESLTHGHFLGGKDMLALYIENNPKAKFFRGKGISIGGAYEQNSQNPKSFYGDVSAVIMANLPKWAQIMRTPPMKVAVMKEWEAKIEKMAEIVSKQRITTLMGVPTWTIVLCQKILEMTGKKTLPEVWEHLELFIHGAVSFTPYRQYFKELIPKENMHYLEIYNASEGFFGVQDDLSRDDMLLGLDYGIFYEFIPMSEWDKEFPNAVTINDVELDKNYALVISTNGGLWRYKIGDTVKFTSLYPHRIKISGRTKHFINAFGEEVIIENAEIAITTACEATGASIQDYTAAPVYMAGDSKGGHEWVIEFKQTPSSLDKFTETLDDKLKEINSDYDAKRYKDMALTMPIIHAVPEGTFYKWMEKRGKLGGQNKVPRLANSREHVEQILEILDLKSS